MNGAGTGINTKIATLLKFKLILSDHLQAKDELYVEVAGLVFYILLQMTAQEVPHLTHAQGSEDFALFAAPSNFTKF